jgi:hypothetical protein
VYHFNYFMRYRMHVDEFTYLKIKVVDISCKKKEKIRKVI